MSDRGRALRLLATPPGLPGSGRLRYGAAMTLYSEGAIGFEALEVFRILAMTDGEDPAPLLAQRRLRLPPPPRPAAADLLDDLAAAVDGVLAREPAGAVAGLRRALARARALAPARPSPDPRALPAGLASAFGPACAAAAAADPFLALALDAALPCLDWAERCDGTDGRCAAAALLGCGAPFASAEAELAIVLRPDGGGAGDGRAARAELWLPLAPPSPASHPVVGLQASALPPRAQ